MLYCRTVRKLPVRGRKCRRRWVILIATLFGHKPRPVRGRKHPGRGNRRTFPASGNNQLLPVRGRKLARLTQMRSVKIQKQPTAPRQGTETAPPHADALSPSETTNCSPSGDGNTVPPPIAVSLKERCLKPRKGTENKVSSAILVDINPTHAPSGDGNSASQLIWYFISTGGNNSSTPR